MAHTTAERLTVDDVLADTATAALARAGHPGHSERSALSILNLADQLAPWGVTIDDIVGDTWLYRYALANDQ